MWINKEGQLGTGDTSPDCDLKGFKGKQSLLWEIMKKGFKKELDLEDIWPITELKSFKTSKQKGKQVYTGEWFALKKI